MECFLLNCGLKLLSPTVLLLHSLYSTFFVLCKPICHTMSTPMLMILKKYNVTQVIIKCFHVPPAVCLRTPRGTRTPGWESLLYSTKIMHCNVGK